MTRNLKAPKVIVIDDTGQGSVSDAIKQVVDSELQRGITILDLSENNSFPYVAPYREKHEKLIQDMDNLILFDKPKSKFHR